MTEQEHLLTILMEECAEVQKACTKALRFGTEDRAPGSPTTNREDIITEYFHVYATFDLLGRHNEDFRPPYGWFGVVKAKQEKVQHYLEYSRKQGTLK